MAEARRAHGLTPEQLDRFASHFPSTLHYGHDEFAQQRYANELAGRLHEPIAASPADARTRMCVNAARRVRHTAREMETASPFYADQCARAGRVLMVMARGHASATGEAS